MANSGEPARFTMAGDNGGDIECRVGNGRSSGTSRNARKCLPRMSGLSGRSLACKTGSRKLARVGIGLHAGVRVRVGGTKAHAPIREGDRES